jgi:toxin ParE1/3/4
MTVRIADRALRRIAEIYAYIAADSETAAARMAQRLLDAMHGLGVNPHLGRPGRSAGVRELVVEPYIVFYRVRREEVLVLNVLHGAQRK